MIINSSKLPHIPLHRLIDKITNGYVGPTRDIYVEEGVPYILAKHIKGNKIFFQSGPYVSKEFTQKHSKSLLKEGYVLLVQSGNVGEAAVVRKEHVGHNCHALIVISPIKDKLNSDYLSFYFNSPVGRNELRKVETGATLKHLNCTKVKTLKIPLPPLPEQKRIAAILDKADAIRRKRQAAITLADDFLRATFLDMFGDPVTNPKGWTEHPLGDHLSFLTSGSRGWAKYYCNSGTLFLRIQNIGRNELLLNEKMYVSPPENAEAKRTLVQPGDVLLSITADLGRVAVIPENFPKAHINQHLAILRIKGIEPYYLSAFLASKGGQRQFFAANKGGVKAGLNFNDIKSAKILLPNSDLQKRWVTFYKKTIDANIKTNSFVEYQNNLFNSLSQRAFRGDL